MSVKLGGVDVAIFAGIPLEEGMRYRQVLFLFLLPLSACDSFYGVESRATFDGPINISCVNTTLYTLPEVGRIFYQMSQSRSTEIAPKRREVQTIMHIWFYGEGQRNMLQINQTPDGWDYRNARSRMGVPVPHEEMVRFLPVMQKVNRAIQIRCGLPVGGLRGEAVGSTKPEEI